MPFLCKKRAFFIEKGVFFHEKGALFMQQTTNSWNNSQQITCNSEINDCIDKVMIVLQNDMTVH